MTTPEPRPPRVRNAVLERLNASCKVFADCLPLALGIHKAIKERLPEIDARDLRAALRIHTGSTRYLKSLAQAVAGMHARYDLDGLPSGEVTAEQRQQASETLRERFKRNAERHKAELLAKKMEQEHEEKLLKLAEKFNRR